MSGEYPDRLIGYDLVNHFLSSAWTNEYAVSSDVEDYYSMVNVTNMAIHHKLVHHKSINHQVFFVKAILLFLRIEQQTKEKLSYCGRYFFVRLEI